MSRITSRIGIFGGTFDPIHLGHISVARCVAAHLELDRVELVVANEPWQKVDTTQMQAAEHRLAMVRAAVGEIDGLVASSLEIERGGPTYTVDTLEQFRANEPDSKLFLIVGSDAAGGMDSWHRYSDIAHLAEVVVVDRVGFVGQRSPVACRVVRWQGVDVSSSEIRHRLRAGEPVGELMPAAALAYCRKQGLYGC